MDGATVLQFLTDYGYWVIVPLMIIEGPIVTLIAAFLASLGVFNVYIVLILSVLGDMIGDIVLYGAGRQWGIQFAHKWGRHIGITPERVQNMEAYFRRHGGKTIFAVKSTTGLCWATFVAAGIAKMHFWRFTFYSFCGGILWSALLVGLGFFFGAFYQEIAQTIQFAGWMIAGLAAVVFSAIVVYKKRKAAQLLRE